MKRIFWDLYRMEYGYGWNKEMSMGGKVWTNQVVKLKWNSIFNRICIGLRNAGYGGMKDPSDRVCNYISNKKGFEQDRIKIIPQEIVVWP